MDQLGSGEALILLVIALVVAGIAWKIVAGVIRLILTIVVIGFVLLVVLPVMLRSVGAG